MVSGLRLRASTAIVLASGGALASGLIASEGHASPQEVLGFGYRSTAMGTTGAAAAQGVDAVYHNPALLSASHDTILELGLVGHSFILDAEGPGLSEPLVAYPGFSATTIGGVLPLPFGGILRDRVALGVGFVTPTDVVVRGRILYPEKPQVLLADRVQSVAVQAALGIDIGYGVRIGGGFAALAALDGAVTVATDASGRIGTVVEDTLVASYAPLAGISYEWDSWRIGASLRGELVGRFNVVITAENLGGLDIPPLNISGVAQYDPWQGGLELTHTDGDVRWALGVIYKHWSAYPGPVEATVRCEDSEAPEEPCDALVPEDPGYSPTVSPRAGAEYQVDMGEKAAALLRAGYAFEPSPAPEQEGRTSYFDFFRSVFSVGYGLRFAEWPIAFDGYGQVQWLHDRRHRKQVEAGALAEGNVDAKGVVVGGGVSGSVRF